MREEERTMNYPNSNYGFTNNGSGRASQTNSVAHSHASHSSTSSHSLATANNTVSSSNASDRFNTTNSTSQHTSGSQQARASSGETVKCVLIGDAGIGKTSLIVSYTTNGYPSEYVPTVFDTYNVTVSVDNEPVRLELVDTAGSGQRADVTEFRRLAYPQTDVLIICFSVVSPESFMSVSQRWLTELADVPSVSGVPRVLVGTQSDMREDAKVQLALTQTGRRPVSIADANQLAANIGALTYIESSALTQRNMKDIFDLAVFATLRRRRSGESQSDDTLPWQCTLRSTAQCASGVTSRSGTLDRRKGASTTPTSTKLGKLFSKRKDKTSESERGVDWCGDSPRRECGPPLELHVHGDAAVIEPANVELEHLDTVDAPRNGKGWKKLFCVGTG